MDHAFQIKVADGEIYTIEIMVKHQPTHYVGTNWEARMVERFVDCKVNGIPGFGFSEFHYRNKTGRSEECKKNDPDWYKSYLSLKTD